MPREGWGSIILSKFIFHFSKARDLHNAAYNKPTLQYIVRMALPVIFF